MPLFTARGLNAGLGRGFEQGFSAYLQGLAQQFQAQQAELARQQEEKLQRNLFEQQNALAEQNQDFITSRDSANFERDFGLRQMDRLEQRRQFDRTASQGDRRLDIAEDDASFNRKLANKKERREAAIFKRSQELDPILRQKAQIEVESAILQLNNQKDLDKPVGGEMLKAVRDFGQQFGFNLGLQPGITTYRQLREIAAPLLSSLAGPAANLEATREARAARDAETERRAIEEALNAGRAATVSPGQLQEMAQRAALTEFGKSADPDARAPFLTGSEPILQSANQAQAVQSARIAYGNLVAKGTAPALAARTVSAAILRQAGLPPMADDGTIDLSSLRPPQQDDGSADLVDVPAKGGSISEALGKNGSLALEFMRAQERGDRKGMEAARRKAGQASNGWEQVGSYLLAPRNPYDLQRMTGVEIFRDFGGHLLDTVRFREDPVDSYKRFFKSGDKPTKEADKYVRQAWGDLIIRNGGQPLKVETPGFGTVTIPSSFEKLRRNQGAFLYVLARAARQRADSSTVAVPFF